MVDAVALGNATSKRRFTCGRPVMRGATQGTGFLVAALLNDLAHALCRMSASLAHKKSRRSEPSRVLEPCGNPRSRLGLGGLNSSSLATSSDAH